MWYECRLQANALWCGVMWCSAGEKKRERVEGERGERVEKIRGKEWKGKKAKKGIKERHYTT